MASTNDTDRRPAAWCNSKGCVYGAQYKTKVGHRLLCGNCSRLWPREELEPFPMKEKYIDEAVGHYTVFGTRTTGGVDVNDGNRDVFIGLPLEKAEKIVQAQAEFRAKLYEILKND